MFIHMTVDNDSLKFLNFGHVCGDFPWHINKLFILKTGWLNSGRAIVDIHGESESSPYFL